MEQNEKVFYNTHVAKPTPIKDDNPQEPQKRPELTNQSNSAIESW